MAWSLGTGRLKFWLRIFQVAIILLVGGVLLLSGIVGVRAGMVRGEPVNVADEKARIAAAQKRWIGGDEADRAGADTEMKAASERIFREERRQAALAGRGRAIGLIVVGGLGYAVLVFEFVRIFVLIRRRRRAEAEEA
jgi:hypothetical protein